MSKELIERLRTGEGMPDKDDLAFQWYMSITDEAADRIEELEREVEELKRRLAYRNDECVIVTKRQLRAWLEDGRDDGSTDWRGENEV